MVDRRSCFEFSGYTIFLCFGGMMCQGFAADAPSDKSAATPKIDAHPIIPGFERFYTDPATDKVRGGQLLLGELNCPSCHAAEESLAGFIIPKQAPILDDVGRRARVKYLRGFIADPRHVKPGSTMPNLFSELPAGEAKRRVEALVHFLVAGGSVVDERIDPKAVGRGGGLFHRVGCVACHAHRRKDVDPARYSVPLGDLAAKYTIPGLTQFLQNPHQVRPAGRMPSLNLNGNEAKDIASFLLQGITIPSKPPNIRFAAYAGSWNEIPDFDKLKPYATGKTAAFDLIPAGRTSNFGMRFDGFIHVPRDGQYSFHLGSDDGSKLYIDGKLVANSDGVHPHQVRSGGARLTSGPHPIRVDYTQVGGEWTLELHYEGPGTLRQPAYASISLAKDTPPPAAVKQKKNDKNGKNNGVFAVDPSLVKVGRKLFASLGCASCHQKKENGKPIEAMLDARPLKELTADRGCLAKVPQPGVPHFNLTSRQRTTLVAAVSHVPKEPVGDAQQIARTMTAFNCYACHARGEVGGVERVRNVHFQGTIPEMGDEGRIPPHLNGIGDKLKADWLKHILDNGANDRLYMYTRMPKFGGANVGRLAGAFAKLDEMTKIDIPEMIQPPHRVKAIGRTIVGEKALACVKCHNFGPYKATGIQSIDLQTMTRRLRADWFHRYMLKPFRYRPGTRMPTGWPNGQSVIPKVLDGEPHRQLRAIWDYLADGNKAAIPLGLLKQAIVLTPDKEPIIYRNFIESLSPRGIAVGYPEQAHLAFDAEQLCVAIIWHGAFIDASKHWVGRGPGTQRPLGDHVMSLVRGVPLAVLDSGDSAWPAGSAKERGYRFRGYRLDKKRQPIFLYGSQAIRVEDYPQPVPADLDTGFKRKLTVTATGLPPENLWYRAAAGSQIEPLADGWFLLDKMLKVRVQSGASKPVVRKHGERTEILLPLVFFGGKVMIVQEYVW